MDGERLTQTDIDDITREAFRILEPALLKGAWLLQGSFDEGRDIEQMLIDDEMYADLHDIWYAENGR